MFVLIGIKDTVPVAPKTFDIAPSTTIKDAINKKYANKLVPDKGLALSVFDILTAEDGKVTWGNGLMYYKVSFRLMLFAPFIGEVIVGRVLSTTKSYIRVSLGFFQDIYIVPSLLPPNSAFDPQQKAFFWVATDDEALSQEQLLNTVVTGSYSFSRSDPPLTRHVQNGYISMRENRYDSELIRSNGATSDQHHRA
ncbi:hypothetical protein, variant [Cryptococcus amylolentus CBS 6039]|uniref:DNA-directed RNA polymerase n=1 Tax=Cryptococcus amylolentus CBS 6039 TaxID=1295533 RepID=A0A1E3HT92_9TREE|nr:hypothetical protein, variant [Cryptococcus amylolentus CBS 6039]ODN79573.1 hypothetical protein, variant [Cryptococcus amylolentus CBS 6039]